MHARNSRIARCLAASFVAAGSLACTSPAPAPTPQSTIEAKAAIERIWTKEFQEESILIAREVSIEGPQGLIDHVAYVQLPEQKYSTKTTAEGFLQEVSVAEGAPNPIRIHLDHLEIAAVKSTRWLERVRAGPVKIHASGDAMWKNLVTGKELRAETIDLVGQPAQ